tara:strand:+ start:2157 stop:2975 length:819 start_codon:yes stop_codon:yes gene_type:complete
MKLYTKKEVGEILKKAADNSSKDDSNLSDGLTIEELQQIASETGIDPEQIARAAAEIDVEVGKQAPTFWGGPFSFNSQVLAEGEITDAQWEEMLISIREFFQSNGEVATRKSVFEWSSPWGTTNSAQVTALKDHGKTKISVSWKGPLTAIPFYIPVPLVAIASVFFASEFLELSSVPGIAFAILATGLSFLAGRWALRKTLNKGFKKLHQMVAGLSLIANAKNRNAEKVQTQTVRAKKKTDTKNPISQIEIFEGESSGKLDNETVQRNRSRT